MFTKITLDASFEKICFDNGITSDVCQEEPAEKILEGSFLYFSHHTLTQPYASNDAAAAQHNYRSIHAHLCLDP